MIEFKVLSRKYRPKKLKDIIGQDFTVKTLTNAECDQLVNWEAEIYRKKIAN